jgi:VWFA-related protein
MRTLNLIAAAAFVAVSLFSAAPAPQNPSPQRPSSPSGAIKTKTRLITVDVVVTDSRGNAVRGLTAGDFRVFDMGHGPQAIAHFEFMDHSLTTAAPHPKIQPPGAAPVYSNEPLTQISVPPTILLMDALNTQIQSQVEARRHMLLLLKTLPATTPIAVLALSHNLRFVQNFTTDTSLLRAAVDKTLNPLTIEQNPQDDPNSASNVALDQNGGTETSETQALEDFEKSAYEQQMAIRVDETIGAMIAIAKYLQSYPGRKNLIWCSASFPLWLLPTSDFGGNPALGLSPSTTKIPGQEFNDSASYENKVRKAIEALADAQVAVYPVDAQGLQTPELYSTAQNPHINRYNPGAGFGAQLNREDTERFSAQATMQELADETGGKPCKNTNDLSGCVESALNDSSVYYELGYSPQDVRWDGSFRKISVKSRQHGLKLRYRNGYFATDLADLANQPPQELLRQACMDPLPSRSIPLTAEAVAPPKSQAPPFPARYLLTISPSALSLASDSGSRQLKLQMAICEFDPTGDSFRFYPHDLSRPVPETLYQVWQTNGIRNIFDYNAGPDDRRLRFVALDVPSGTTGAVDVPAHPREFASEPGHIVPVVSPALASQPTPAAAKAPVQVITQLTFRSPSGASSVLDWRGDKLSYHGNLGINQGAPALFKSLFESRYHCDAGKLVSNDASSTAPPSYLLTFHSPTGPSALVELGGDSPAYSGNLPVDASARAFFDYLWKLCHCQQP